MKDDKVYLQHILECIDRIEEYTVDGKDAFLDERLYQDAVLRNLQTLAESTQRLSDDIKAAQSHIPWRSISAFRNVLVHNYLGIDLETTWHITRNEITQLKTAVEAMLEYLLNEQG